MGNSEIKLTPPEIFFLARRRKNCTQRQFAKYLAASQSKVSRWETGHTAIPAGVMDFIRKKFTPTDNELLTIERRRRGDRIEDAAQKLKITRPYLSDVERTGRGGKAKQHLENYIKES